MYYDGTKLLSLKDKNGNKPEIFITVGNRSSGKTTYFSRLLVNNYNKKNKKFCLVYRYINELEDISNKFFKDINSLFFNNYEMTEIAEGNGYIIKLFLNKKHCGYAIALNSADKLKKLSHLLSDTEIMFFDEFQTENSLYLNNEVEKLLSVHTTIARGQGKSVRYVPVIMCSNCVTLLNPYFSALNISQNIQENTKFYKGDGFVLEQNFNEEVAERQNKSAFNRAFSNNRYLAYSSQNVYLNDNKIFISNMQGNNSYFATIKYQNKNYAIRFYENQGIVYCDTNADLNYPLKIALDTDDMNINYIILNKNSAHIKLLREFFNNGCFRFKNLECKNMIFKLLQIT